MPAFPNVHEQINGLSAGEATSMKPTEWFTDKMQAKEKGKTEKMRLHKVFTIAVAVGIRSKSQ